MPFQYFQFQVEKSTIYLLEFDASFEPNDFLDHLSAVEKETYFTFISGKRRKEFVATRLLMHSIFSFAEIKYESHGAPYIDRNEFISISHSNNIVGIAVNKEHMVGFDMELIHNKVLKLHSKFLTDEESKEIDVQSVEELIASWSMKESLYKLAARKELDFKEQLNFKKIKPNNFLGKITLKNKIISVHLHYFTFKNYILSINTQKPIYVESTY